MAQNESARRRMDRLVYAYVLDEAALKVNPKRALPKGARYAIVSPTRIISAKLAGLSRTASVMRLTRSPEVESPGPQVKSDAYQPDAKARALLRGVKLVENDLRASGGAYSLTEVRELMHGITRQAVNNRVREGTLLAVPGPSNRATYPVVQFLPDGSPVEGLKEVRDVLGTANGWMLLNFLVNPEPKLANKRPIELLKAGKVEKVVEVARRVGVQAA